jgi:DNA-directed RNA polymerase specialized sigma24 family protein
VKALRSVTPGSEEEKAAFLRLAAFIMKRLLIHHARPLHRNIPKVAIEEMDGLAAPAAPSLNELDATLDRLEAINPRMRAVVEMKVFQGCSFDEIAAQLHCGRRTVVRDWSFARHWLEAELAS